MDALIWEKIMWFCNLFVSHNDVVDSNVLDQYAGLC